MAVVSRPVGFRFSCLFVRKVSRTACGQYPERFRVGLLSASPSNGGPYSSFFSWFIRTFCWMRRSPLRARGVLPNRRRNSSSLIASHSRSEIVSGSNRGIEMRRAVHGGFLVVGTAALAAIAAEDPSVEVGQGAVGLLFDRTTGDATVRVDHLGRDDGSRRTTVQAVPAAAATGSCERGIVLVGRQGKYQLAQQDIGAVLGREQQGLPPDPAQTRFDGQLFFQQRSRIDERAAREPGVLPAQGFEHRAQHPLEDGW